MRLGPAIGLSLALAAAPLDADPARLLGSFDWDGAAPWFGGWSGLELSADGREMVAISDRGTLLRGHLRRVGDRIAAVERISTTQLKDTSGRPLDDRSRDAEGLALLPEGGVAISFEGAHRLDLYLGDSDPARALPRLPVAGALPFNGGFEALAVDEEGRLYAVAEDHLDDRGRIPVFLWDGQAWSRPFTLEKRGRFLPVGADFGPDGRFYLLERAFGMTGFRSRLRRWTLTEGGATGEATLLQTGAHDNLEGLAIWRDEAGGLRATMISDDNFLPIQRSEIVEYALPE